MILFLDLQVHDEPVTKTQTIPCLRQELFQVPVGRSWQDFLDESRQHGWPSFRDAEVVPDRVRVLEDGETVSVDDTHLGHNLADSQGNRYCINLVSVAGVAPGTQEGKTQSGGFQ